MRLLIPAILVVTLSGCSGGGTDSGTLVEGVMTTDDGGAVVCTDHVFHVLRPFDGTGYDEHHYTDVTIDATGRVVSRDDTERCVAGNTGWPLHLADGGLVDIDHQEMSFGDKVLVAVDAAGAERWRTTLWGTTKETELFAGTGPTTSRIHVQINIGRVVALDVADGHIIWSNDFR